MRKTVKIVWEWLKKNWKYFAIAWLVWWWTYYFGYVWTWPSN